MKKIINIIAACLAVVNITFATAAQSSSNSQKALFNDNWNFSLAENTDSANEKALTSKKFDDSKWERVSLPHTAHMEPLLVNNQWQGICWYRKDFDIENYSSDKLYFVEFEAMMNHATIWINGEQVSTSQGGYLPVVLDITPYITASGNVIAIRLDNRDNEVTGPKPLKILDFNMYGGIYRNAWLTEKNQTHITDPILANRPASGGIFITYPKVSKELSQVKIQTHIANRAAEKKSLWLSYNIFRGEELIREGKSETIEVDAFAEVEFKDIIDIKNAALWSPDEPNMHCAEVTLWCDGEKLDQESEKFGIREFSFVDNQLYINGVKTFLRGVNRHQEYPYIGYALSDNAQYRDAKKIKDAGFDYIRLSHYPHSDSFMDACDELGLVVTNAILGWQFFKDNDAFRQDKYDAARTLVRRDRNHPCVMTWEMSINETRMPISFMQTIHNITHQEFPGEHTFTSGWMSDVYDVYFQARQHRIVHPKQMTFFKPYMVSEYGDWEYFATNAGLNQHMHSEEKRIELSSRQLRGQGEARLLRQAYNVQEAHNDNMNIPATADSYWVMYDYNRGYHDELESSGIMDIFRLPKFAYSFYASQRSGTPYLEIATYWNDESPLDVKVYSNCDEVALYLNGKLVAKQSPDSDANCTNLNHPPFTFKMKKFVSGELKAIAYNNGKKVKESIVRTAKKPKRLKIWLDESNRQAEAGCNDVLFLYIAAVDSKGTICTDYIDAMDVKACDGIEILNTDGVVTEAGIATALIRIGESGGTATITATSGKLDGEINFDILSK